MRMDPSDLEIETIVSRIKRKDIDLQPDFQRGEVWSDVKKKRLIDTILRAWHIPPIHIIELKDNSQQVVLDGQQRLIAIRDFANDLLSVDGNIEPSDPEIAALDGLTYSALPNEWKRRFNQFPIRFIKITDYKPQEPGELFFRLNQPTYLTSAEQRNAFFGPAREQVKRLVSRLEFYGVGKEFTGFSNSRMAYDDVIARLCFSLEVKSLTEKITSIGLADRYRSESGFPNEVIKQAEDSVVLFGSSKPFIHNKLRFNKATLYSWLWFITQARALLSPQLTPELLGTYISFFESKRQGEISVFELQHQLDGEKLRAVTEKIGEKWIDALFHIYTDRATSRVADVSSVLYRDLIIWILYMLYIEVRGLNLTPDSITPNSRRYEMLPIYLPRYGEPRKNMHIMQYLDTVIRDLDWGRSI